MILRRSAVRNMERAGVSQAVAMKITGHTTARVYRRYRIVDETDQRGTLERTEATMRREPSPRTLVVLSGPREATP